MVANSTIAASSNMWIPVSEVVTLKAWGAGLTSAYVIGMLHEGLGDWYFTGLVLCTRLHPMYAARCSTKLISNLSSFFSA